MNLYKIQLKLNSPLITPLMGDTLFGHMCWGIVYNEGVPFLEKLLSGFDNEPFVVSDGFPSGYLPRPLLKPEKHTTYQSISGKDLQIRKIIKKNKYIPKEWMFEEHAWSDNRLIDKMTKQKVDDYTPYDVSRMHNSINRVTGAAEEGKLFSKNEIWFGRDHDKMLFDVYVSTTFKMDIVEKFFLWGLESGYGADKSTGKGAFTIIEIVRIENQKKGNRALALGAFIPNNDKVPQNIRAFTRVKFGKLGGYFASAGNPFKKPFLMYSSGTTFDAEQEDFEKLYRGKLLKDIHKSEIPIRHHAAAPLIFFNEDKEYA